MALAPLPGVVPEPTPEELHWLCRCAITESAGGTPDPLARILLSAVKFGEPTDTSGCPSLPGIRLIQHPRIDYVLWIERCV